MLEVDTYGMRRTTNEGLKTIRKTNEQIVAKQAVLFVANKVVDVVHVTSALDVIVICLE